jgi:uncharacterized protein (DUF1501 family)
MKGPHVNRRTVLAGGLALGVGAGWASTTGWGVPTPQRPRLVVLALDGGADGLSLAPPREAAYSAMRGALTIRNPLPFDADFGLHPALKEVAAMAELGEVRLAPAAASPTLSRSHFLESDILQSGFVDPRGARTGWLNRAVAALAPGQPLAAVTLEAAAAVAATGPAPFGTAAPGGGLNPDMAWRLHELYRDAPDLRRLVESGRAVRSEMERATPLLPAAEPQEVASARMAGRLLAAPEGPSAAFLTLGGFDTHVGQGADGGVLAGRFALLDAMLAALKAESGRAWNKTVVIVHTEFGRTARPNGAGGTDHGAASAALLLGGAVKEGGGLGDWPGLRRLHEDRDLAPGLDLRRLFKGVLAEHWGLDRRLLETDIFPGSLDAQALGGLIV